MNSKCSLQSSSIATWLIGGGSIATALCGWHWESELCLIAGTIGTLALAVLIIRRRRAQRNALLDFPIRPASSDKPPAVTPEPGDEQSLVEQMLAQGRFALLLRPQIASELDASQFTQAVEQFENAMALVPAGRVAIGQIDDLLEEGRLDLELLARRPVRVVDVAPVFLDRFAVTNGEYQRFVASGGYDLMTIWEEEIWPAVLDFVDQTGQPGPADWSDGQPAPGTKALPVVGICWYEAQAYARWVGRRLPSDAEWVKAGCWPVVLKGGSWVQRRYPWGNAFDHAKANVWGSRPGGLVPVDAYPEGVSVGGLHQLIGNTWEWTSTSFGVAGDPAVAVTTPMKSIRGGAFDTYFETHATCHFQSGESPLSRKHNIGFRLALSAADLSTRLSSFSPDGEQEIDPALPLSEGVTA